MIKVEHLTETELEEIGEAYANYNYTPNDKGMFPFDDRELLKKYIMGFAKFCIINFYHILRKVVGKIQQLLAIFSWRSLL